MSSWVTTISPLDLHIEIKCDGEALKITVQVKKVQVKIRERVK